MRWRCPLSRQCGTSVSYFTGYHSESPSSSKCDFCRVQSCRLYSVVLVRFTTVKAGTESARAQATHRQRECVKTHLNNNSLRHNSLPQNSSRHNTVHRALRQNSSAQLQLVRVLNTVVVDQFIQVLSICTRIRVSGVQCMFIRVYEYEASVVKHQRARGVS